MQRGAMLDDYSISERSGGGAVQRVPDRNVDDEWVRWLRGMCGQWRSSSGPPSLVLSSGRASGICPWLPGYFDPTQSLLREQYAVVSEEWTTCLVRTTRKNAKLCRCTAWPGLSPFRAASSFDGITVILLRCFQKAKISRYVHREAGLLYSKSTNYAMENEERTILLQENQVTERKEGIAILFGSPDLPFQNSSE